VGCFFKLAANFHPARLHLLYNEQATGVHSTSSPTKEDPMAVVFEEKKKKKKKKDKK